MKALHLQTRLDRLRACTRGGAALLACDVGTVRRLPLPYHQYLRGTLALYGLATWCCALPHAAPEGPRRKRGKLWPGTDEGDSVYDSPAVPPPPTAPAAHRPARLKRALLIPGMLLVSSERQP